MTLLLPNGVPDPWLNLLAEVTGAVPLVLVAFVIVLVYGSARLADREILGLEHAGLPTDS